MDPSKLPETQNIFTKISDPDEKIEVLTRLSNSRVLLNVKALDDKIMGLRIAKLTSKEISCLLPKSKEVTIFPKMVICSFTLSNERYFFRTQCWVTNSMVILDSNFTLFKLQRRNHYRVDIPARIKAAFDITHMNRRKFFHKIPIVDISSGGVKLKGTDLDFEFKPGDQLEGTVYIPGKASIDVKGEVRYTDVKDSGKNVTTIAGLKFVEVKASVERRLFNLVLELHRDLNALFNS